VQVYPDSSHSSINNLKGLVNPKVDIQTKTNQALTVYHRYMQSQNHLLEKIATAIKNPQTRYSGIPIAEWYYEKINQEIPTNKHQRFSLHPTLSTALQQAISESKSTNLYCDEITTKEIEIEHTIVLDTISIYAVDRLDLLPQITSIPGNHTLVLNLRLSDTSYIQELLEYTHKQNKPAILVISSPFLTPEVISLIEAQTSATVIIQIQSTSKTSDKNIYICKTQENQANITPKIVSEEEQATATELLQHLYNTVEQTTTKPNIWANISEQTKKQLFGLGKTKKIIQAEINTLSQLPDIYIQQTDITILDNNKSKEISAKLYTIYNQCINLVKTATPGTLEIPHIQEYIKHLSSILVYSTDISSHTEQITIPHTCVPIPTTQNIQHGYMITPSFL
jgi:hypothetical protein